MSPVKSTLRRWRDLIGYSLIAAILAIPLGTIIQGLVQGFAARIFEAPLPLFILSSNIYLIAFWLIIKHAGLIHLRHFHHTLTYPSALISIPLSLGFLVAIVVINPSLAGRSIRSQIWQSGFVWAEIIALLATLLFVLIALKSSLKFKRRKSSSGDPKNIVSKDIFSIANEELFDWLSSESPINDISQDYFGAAERAKSVAKALLVDRVERNGKELRQTVVIQGDFGAGKSSILTLVQNIVRSESKEPIIFVTVSCWGFSSIAAQENILEAALNELLKEVDCLGLRALPSDYVDAVTKANSWLGALFRLSNSSSDPVKNLERISTVLKSIGAHLMVIVEDTDRNGPDFNQKHIEAMLNNFRSVERISFVLTAGSKTQIDFPKIAEYILILPRLPEEKVLPLIDKIRNHCRTSVSYVDPMLASNYTNKIRSDSLEDESKSRRFINDMTAEAHWTQSLAALLHNPRKLKNTLSRIVKVWPTLRGEVDLDEFIMLTTLRCCAPSVYTFFGSNFYQFETIFKTRDNKNGLTNDEWLSKRKEFIIKEWERAVEESDYGVEDLGAIVSELTPWVSSLTGVRNLSKKTRPQSIISDRSSVYWERLSTESLKESEILDQDVLSLISKATNEHGVDALGENAGKSRDFSELVLFFKKRYPELISDETLLQTAASALKHLGKFENFSFSGENSSYRSIIRWLNHMNLYENTSFVEWLKQRLAICLPHRLQDITILYSDTQKLLDDNGRHEIRKWIVEECKNHFAKLTPKQFSSFFDNTNPYSLGHLIRFDKNPSDHLLTQGKYWSWIASLLLKGMEEFPQIMLPQVMMLFGNYGPAGEVPTYFKFDETELEALFENNLPQAVALLAHPFDITEDMEPWFKLASPLGTKSAQEWLLRLQEQKAS